jgi:hypothetical protein
MEHNISIQIGVTMNNTEKVQELVAIADSMASSLATVGQGTQNYESFIYNRDELQKRLEEYLVKE